MRRIAPLLLLLAAACGNADPAPDQVLTAAGTAVPEAPVTVPPPTTVTTVPPTSTTRPVASSTTTVARTAMTRPTHVPVTPAPPIAGYAPPPPPPGVEADGYGGYGGVTSLTTGDAVVELSVYPREQYFGEFVQVKVAVTSKEMWSAKTDMGNGVVFDGLGGGTCSVEPKMMYGGAPPFYTYPAPGQYTIKATVTIIPCIAIPGPPGSPPGAPSPFASDRRTLETLSMGLNQRADRPPPPVGPPPGR